MATKKSTHVTGVVPMPSAMGKETIHVYESLSLAVGDIALAGVIQYFTLPAGCLPVNYRFTMTDMDVGASPVLAADFGILTTAGTAVSSATADGGKWLTATAALGVTAVLVTSDASLAAWNAIHGVTVSTVDRTVGFVITTAAQTAAAGTLALEFAYKSQN